MANLGILLGLKNRGNLAKPAGSSASILTSRPFVAPDYKLRREIVLDRSSVTANPTVEANYDAAIAAISSQVDTILGDFQGGTVDGYVELQKARVVTNLFDPSAPIQYRLAATIYVKIS